MGNNIQFEDISEEMFLKYEEIRESGVVNMFDMRKVIELSDYVFNLEELRFIMNNYKELYKKYN